MLQGFIANVLEQRLQQPLLTILTLLRYTLVRPKANEQPLKGVDMDPFTIVFPILLAACSFVLWTIFSTIRRYKIARLQADLQAKLVDKFGTTQDLIAYSDTETGREFLRSLSLEQRSPYDRIIGAVQAGIISFFVGAALLFLRSRVSGGEQVLLVFGTILATLGISFVLAAAASYSLSKSLGLLNRASAQR